MYWFILLFPFLIYPWTNQHFYTIPKLFYLDFFVLCTWCTLVVKRNLWTRNVRNPFLAIEIPVILFLGLIVLSTIFSVNPTTSLLGTSSRFEGLFTFVSYCSIFVFSYRLMNITYLKKIIPGLACVSMLLSIYGILQHYSFDFLPRRTDFVFDSIRSYSLFDNPNFFGSYIVMVIMLTTALFILEKSKGFSAFLYLTICLAFTAMLFSSTRSAWVGMFFGFLFLTAWVVLKRKSIWKKWTFLLISFIAIFTVINTVESGGYLNRLSSSVKDPYKVLTNQSTGQEGSSRLFIWTKSLPLIKQYYLIGSGPDTFEYVFPDDQEKKQYFGDIIVDKAHNEYIQMAITLGIPALLTYLLLVFLVLKKAFQAVKVVQENEKIMLYGLISAILAYLIQAFFNISVVPVAPLYWSILGITYGISTYHLAHTKNLNLVNEPFFANKENQTA